MAKTKPVANKRSANTDRLYRELAARVGSAASYSPQEFLQPDKDYLGDILKQRHNQRKWLFRYAIGFSSFSVVGLAALLIAQGVYKSTYGTELFGNLELGTVGIGVFVQFLGLLKIITDSLWNDKPYLDSGALAGGRAK